MIRTVVINSRTVVAFSNDHGIEVQIEDLKKHGPKWSYPMGDKTRPPVFAHIKDKHIENERLRIHLKELTRQCNKAMETAYQDWRYEVSFGDKGVCFWPQPKYFIVQTGMTIFKWNDEPVAVDTNEFNQFMDGTMDKLVCHCPSQRRRLYTEIVRKKNSSELNVIINMINHELKDTTKKRHRFRLKMARGLIRGIR